MSPTDIEDILAITPFKPLRFTLSSGDKFIVDRQFRTMVGDGGLLYVSLADPDPETGRKLRLISTVNISMVERLDSVPPAKPGRRRRR